MAKATNTRQKFVPKDRNELGRMLKVQFDLLIRYGTLYDEGEQNFILPMATVIRVLVHDTVNSHSLLAQMGIKDRLRFTDTAHPISQRNLLPTHAGLVVTRLTVGPDGNAKYIAPLADHPQIGIPAKRFGVWWETPITRIVDASWSRKDLVLDLVNKEGGAHVDSRSEDTLRKLGRDNLMGWTFNNGNGEMPVEQGPQLPSIRQIAWELEDTFRASSLIDSGAK